MSPAATGVDAAEMVANLRAKIIKIRNNTMAAMGEAMGESLKAGEEVAQQRIESAVTKTGMTRAARHGGSPGRIDTGSFYDDFQHDSYQVDPNHMQGRLGWIGEDGNPLGNASAEGKSYFEFQDLGTIDVPAVHALLDASEVAKEEFKKRFKEFRDKEFN